MSNMSEQSTASLKAMLNKGSGASATEVRAAITELKKRGEDTPPPSLVIGGRREMSKGGNATKKVPVVTIGVGMAEMKEDKKKYAKGGYANCGASMSATQDSSRKMMGGGYATKKKY